MRKIVGGRTRRCPRCLLTPRWCICAGGREVRIPLAVDVLMHRRESFRPTSTGHLIGRILPESRRHVWSHDLPIPRAAVVRPERDLWVLHPHGRPAPAGADPARVQVLLLDGVWSETAVMARAVSSWGRLVSLRMTGASRYWLRTQQDGGRFSTAEALLHVLRTFGLEAAHRELHLQFELHVYACLRVRGMRERAEAFLRDSPIRGEFPGLLERLHEKQPLE